MLMRTTRSTVIAVVAAFAVVLLIIGIGFAASGSGEKANATPTATASAEATLAPSSTAPAATPSATATTAIAPEATATATSAPPTATQPPPATTDPDTPVSDTPGNGGGAPVPVLPSSDLPPIPADRHRIEAPIDGLDVLVLESFPPQYMLNVQAGLPSGCAERAGYEASRSGTTITVKVYDSLPNGAVACTMIYGMYELNIPLGSDYEPGVTYTVQVNDQTTTFVAQ